MIDPKERAKMDQALAGLAETVPPMLWAVYKGCKEQGFNDTQAMDIIMCWVSAMVTRPVDPNDYNE